MAGERTGLGLIVRDLARAVGADTALLAVAASDGVEVLAAWSDASTRDGPPSSLVASGFVGRALDFPRPAVESIDQPDQSAGTAGTHGGVRQALGARVRPIEGPAGALCAVFTASPERDLDKTLWLIGRYAQLAELCLQDRDTLETLLSGAHIDGLTGCLTQAEFLRELRREIARSNRHQFPISCAFIDLDRFKRINDRFGHLHGSRLLASIAGVLRAEIRSEDTIGRYGGDEFVLLLPNTDEDAAVELAERLRSRITTKVVNLPHDAIDASIGVAQAPPGRAGEGLLAAADEALLQAKAAGGARVVAASSIPSAEPVVDAASAETLAESSDAPKVVYLPDVLGVIAEFDQSGGASIELTAWELNGDPAAITDLWTEAQDAQLISRCGMDPGTGEDMWQLTDAGRRVAQQRSAQAEGERSS